MRGDEPYAAEPIDVWGSGVILFTMIVGSTSHPLQARRDILDLNLTLLDTPWDEPTKGSHEFKQYLTGECFNYEPWSCFSEDILCTSISAVLISTSTAHHMPLTAVLTGMLDVEATTRMRARGSHTVRHSVNHVWIHTIAHFEVLLSHVWIHLATRDVKVHAAW